MKAVRTCLVLLIAGISNILAGCNSLDAANRNLNTSTQDAYGNTTCPSGKNIIFEKQKTNPEDVSIHVGDLNTDYSVIGEISVKQRKLSLAQSDPTREEINAELREKSANMGADAVIFVRYYSNEDALFPYSMGKGCAVSANGN